MDAVIDPLIGYWSGCKLCRYVVPSDVCKFGYRNRPRSASGRRQQRPDLLNGLLLLVVTSILHP